MATVLVLDANILIRAVLGSKVLRLLRRYAEHTEFWVPDTVFGEVIKHLSSVLEKHQMPVAPAITTLELVAKLVRTIDPETYSPYETLARQRINRRDENDRPILASALALDCPIWTEDKDFFRLRSCNLDHRPNRVVSEKKR